MEWSTHVEKIQTLLEGDNSAVVQAHELMLALMPTIISDGVQETFRPLFDGFDIEEQSLDWLSYESRNQGFFWLWVDLYYRLFPAELQNVPTRLDIRDMTQWPVSLNHSSCKYICFEDWIFIEDPETGEEVPRCTMDGIEHSNVKVIEIDGDYSSVLDIDRLLKGTGPLLIKCCYSNSKIKMAEINGKREVTIIYGDSFYDCLPNVIRNLNRFPHLQILGSCLYNLEEDLENEKFDFADYQIPWGKTSPYSYLEWNDVALFLDDDITQPLNQRVKHIHIKNGVLCQVFQEYDYFMTRRDNSENNSEARLSATQVIFSQVVFPNVETIEFEEFPNDEFRLDTTFLQHFPRLRMIQATCHLFYDLSFNVCSLILDVEHPLEIIHQQNETLEFLFFDKSLGVTLREQLTQMSIDLSNQEDYNIALLDKPLFSGQTFPELTTLEIYSCGFKLDTAFLQQFPKLKIIYGDNPTSIVIGSTLFDAEHPLEIMYQRNVTLEFLLFDKSLGVTLREQLTQVSIESQWVLKNIDQFKNIQNVNLNNAFQNLSRLLSLSQLKVLFVEQDAQDIPKNKFLFAEFNEPAVLEEYTRPEPLPNEKSIPLHLLEYVAALSSNRDNEFRDLRRRRTRITSFAELMAHWTLFDDPFLDEDTTFGSEGDSSLLGTITYSNEFVQEFVQLVRTNNLPTDFLEWFTDRANKRGNQRTSIYIGQWRFWLNHKERPSLWFDNNRGDALSGGYGSTYVNLIWVDYLGSHYLNLEKIFVGYPSLLDEVKSVLTCTNLYDSSCVSMNSEDCDDEDEQAIQNLRYNDDILPFEVLEQMPALIRLKVEHEAIVSDLPRLQRLQVLYVNNLSLSTLPSDLGELTELEELYLWGNELTTLPDSMSKMSKLWKINISKNQFTDLPEVLLSLPNLREICFRGYEPDIEALRLRNAQFVNRLEAGEVVIWNGNPKTVAV